MRETVERYFQSLDEGDYLAAAEQIDPEHRLELWSALRDVQQALASIGEERGVEAMLKQNEPFGEIDAMSPLELVARFLAGSLGPPSKFDFRVDTVTEIGTGRGIAVYSVAGFSNTLDLSAKEGRWYVRLRHGIEELANMVLFHVCEYELRAQTDLDPDPEVELRPRALHGFVDPLGRPVIAPRFASVGEFAEGLAPVQLIHCWGYIDRTGQLILPARYLEAQPFSEGVAWVRLSGVSDPGFALIDRNAELLIPPSFREAKPFSEGLAAVRQQGRWGFITPAGRWRIPARYSEVEPFRGGYADVHCPEQGPQTIDRNGRPIFSSGETDEGLPG